MNFVRAKNLGLDRQIAKIGIRKFEFVAKAQFLKNTKFELSL